MSRLVPYRTKAPEEVATRIEETLGATMYLMQTTGPTSYVIQEQNCEKKHKVLIGEMQTCSCGDPDICIHILFVMLKVLRVPATTPVVWQKSLIDSEIEMLLRGGYRQQSRPATKPFMRRRKEKPAVPQTEEDSDVERHELVEGEVCAICQEDMEDNQPLTFCRKGCGNNFHIECMKVFGESRRQSKENIICPLCRHDWGDLALSALRKEIDVANRAPDVHKNTSCRKCHTKPLRYERYRCVQCKNTDLCARCFKSNAHLNHAFVMKKNVSDPWVPTLREGQRRSALASDIISDLEGRELSTNDYELLLQLDQGEKYPIQDYLITVLAGTKVDAQNAKTFGEPGTSCSLCSQALRMQVDLRSLICGHIFHESCLSRSILSQVYTCPFPGCDQALFPGLHHLSVKKNARKSGTAEANKTSGNGLPHLDPSFAVLGIQQRGSTAQVDEQAQRTASTGLKSLNGPRLARQKGSRGKEELPPLLGLHTVGLSPHPRQLVSPELSSVSASASERRSTPPTQSLLTCEANTSSRPQARSSQSSTARSNPTRPLRKGNALPRLGQLSPLPPFGADENVTLDRLDQAERARVELKNIGKERLRKQRLQREERSRRHQESNNRPPSALGGGLLGTSHGQGADSDRMTQAQRNRTVTQQRAQQERQAKRKLKEQQLRLRQQQQLPALDSLFIGRIK